MDLQEDSVWVLNLEGFVNHISIVLCYNATYIVYYYFVVMSI